MLCGSETLSEGGYGRERFSPSASQHSSRRVGFLAGRAIQRSDATPLISGSLLRVWAHGLDRLAGVPLSRHPRIGTSIGLFTVSSKGVAQTFLERPSRGS